MEATIKNTQMLPEESTPRSSTTTCSLSATCLFDADPNDLKEHLTNTQMQQSVLDEYLLSGFQMVQKKNRELQQVAKALTLLLEFGAKWKYGMLLEDQMTPHHLICQSNGDNHELLDLIIAQDGGTLINNKSHDGSTALLYAVKNANPRCVKDLIANNANVNLEDDSYAGYSSFSSQQTWGPIYETIERLHPDSEYSSIVMTDIFDLLLDSGVDVNKPYRPLYPKPIEYAISRNNAQCVKKLIEKGVCLDNFIYGNVYVWSVVARMGSVDLLKCMLDHGIDKECKDTEGNSLLSHIVQSGNAEAIRYLLDVGVAMTCTTSENEITCKHCGEIRLLINIVAEDELQDPHLMSCELNMLHVVRLLEEYGSQNFKSMNALRYAVIHNSLQVVEHLLAKYSYPLNVEYARKCGGKIDYQNILIEACSESSDAMIKLLLDHGADPNTNVCEEKASTALTTAIIHEYDEIVARFIKCGVDVNRRSYYQRYGNVLPFEAAVLYNNEYAAEMLLISGCSCGVFSLDADHKFKMNVQPELEKLMKKWNVQENNVTSLQIQCRKVILKHLSPKAVDNIDGSLPQCIVKYLNFCELDDIVEAGI